MPERLKKLDKAARQAHAAGLGKLLPEALYIAKDRVRELPAALQAQYDKAEAIAGRRRYPYSVVKLGLDGKRVSFLSYPTLKTSGLPRLARTASVDLRGKTVTVIDYTGRASPPVLHRKELVMGKKAKKGQKNPKSKHTTKARGKQRALAAAFVRTAKARAFAAVDRRKKPMSDGAIKVTFGGWGIKGRLTHRYEARAAIRPSGITVSWSNKSVKGKTAAKALDAAAKAGLFPNRSDAARWRDQGEQNPAMAKQPRIPEAIRRARTAAKKAKVKRPTGKKRRVIKTFTRADGSTGFIVDGKIASEADYRKAKGLKPKQPKVPQAIRQAGKAAKKAATKAQRPKQKKARKNPATSLAQQVGRQAKMDLEDRGYTDVKAGKTAKAHTLTFTAWTRGKPHRRATLVAGFSQPYAGYRGEEGTITVDLDQVKPTRKKIGTWTVPRSISAVTIPGTRAAAKYQARKPVAAGKAKRPSVLAGLFQNPADEEKAWKEVRKVFVHERAQMRKQFPELISTGLKPDPKVHDTERHYAEAGKNKRGEVWVRVAPALGLLPKSKIVGVIRHELGHAAIYHGYEPMVKGRTAKLTQYDRRERQADRVAEKLSGHKIYYDAKGIEVSGPGARGKRPRPAGLR